jgi:predicted enzyme related to lactoylglutathione lyase
MNRPIHIELRPPDTDRAQKFWSAAFGWTFTKQPGPMEYWGVSTGPETDAGVHGGMMKPRDGQPRCVPWIEVTDVDAATQKVVQLGGQVRVPTMPVPGVGELAYCADPDGIVFAVVRCSTTG